MKNLLFAFAFTSVLFSCKKEGCTQSYALNYDPYAEKDCSECCTYKYADTGGGTTGGGTKNPSSGYGSNISDIDGNSYKTVYIGNQQWMAENLKVTKYNDSTAIPNIIDNTQWSNLTTGAWVYLDNDVANNAKYGKLYNWYAASPTMNGNKNVCPIGWHLPSQAEWTVLTEYLGGESVAGTTMKEVSSWFDPDNITAADPSTNTSLFTGLPGGLRDEYGHFVLEHMGGYWWSSNKSQTNTDLASGQYLYYNNCYAYGIGAQSMKYGYSVRCLRD